MLIAVNSAVGWDAQRWLLARHVGESALRVTLVWVQLVSAYGIVAVTMLNWVLGNTALRRGGLHG